MLTASQVRQLTGVPVLTLHDWWHFVKKREHGIQAPGPHHVRLSGRPLAGGRAATSTTGWNQRASDRRSSPLT